MRQYVYWLLLIVVALPLFSGCSSSMIFSPAVNLPVKTLERCEVDIQGGFELFPETRPHASPGSVAPDASLLVGYGITNKSAIYAKGWIDMSNRGRYATRSGFSLNMVSQLKQFGPNTKLLVLPKVGMALDGKYNGGYGIELPLILHHTIRQKIGLYGGFGFMYGIYDFERSAVNFNEMRLQSGYAITNHLGASVILYKNLRLNAELSSLYIHNRFEDRQQLILSPSIGIGYTFK